MPMSFNRWNYVVSNPINFRDPSGLNPNCQHVWQSVCANQRLLEIVSEEKSLGINALIRLFDDDELYYYWGNTAGRTTAQRLAWILASTRGSGGGGGPRYTPGIFKGPLGDLLVCGALPFQFGIDISGDTGFATEFQDQVFYNDPLLWGNPASNAVHLSTQVQHFLTAVALSGYGEFGLRVTIGHEKLSDRTATELQQIKSTTNSDLQRWYKAADADLAGNMATRDAELWAILNFGPDIDFGEVDPNRVGNSIQDLRLSLKGFLFYGWIQENKTRHPSWAALWLRENLQGK